MKKVKYTRTSTRVEFIKDKEGKITGRDTYRHTVTLTREDNVYLVWLNTNEDDITRIVSAYSLANKNAAIEHAVELATYPYKDKNWENLVTMYGLVPVKKD